MADATRGRAVDLTRTHPESHGVGSYEPAADGAQARGLAEQRENRLTLTV